MKTIKWVLIAMLLMVLAYAFINAAISFIYAVYVGCIAVAVVSLVFLYVQVKKYFKKDEK